MKRPPSLSLASVLLFSFLSAPAAAQGTDWANLAKYREADARLGAPAAGERRVIFFGDSITEYWKLGDSFPGKGYIDRGISGQTTPQMRLRFSQDVLALKPAVVVILAGTNDIAGNTGPEKDEEIEENLGAMAALAKREGISVILASILPAARYPWKPDVRPVERILAIDAWIKNYAGKNGIIFVDYYSAMADERHGLPAAFSGDGVHPNPAGYAVMTPLAQEAVDRALNGR
jgi:lysophospholipase L1-like esterase